MVNFFVFLKLVLFCFIVAMIEAIHYICKLLTASGNLF